MTEKLKASPTAMALVHGGRRRRGRLVAARVGNREGLEGRLIEAVRHALLNDPDPDEARWIDRIEDVRRSLTRLADPVEFPAVDGAAGSTRSIGEMTASSKPPRWAYLLMCLVRAARPAVALELGACVGISAAYQSAGLELNGAGRLVSLEGAPVLARRSAQTQVDVGLDRAEFRVGLFTDTLPGVLAELGTIDWAFIDGHHKEEPTLEYTEMILSHARPGSVLVYDDVAHENSPGVVRAWRKLSADERFGLVLDLGAIGVCVVGGRHDVVRIPYA